MLLTSAELDHKKRTTTENDEKLAKIKLKKKGEKPKRNCLNTNLASDQTPSILANAQTDEMALMFDLVYVRRIAVNNAWQLHKNIF